MLAIDSHLDLSMNALSYDRDLKKSVYEIRKHEKEDDKAIVRRLNLKSAGNNTVALPEMRKGEVFLSLATLLATVKKQTRGTFSCKEIAYAVAHGQLAYYQCLEAEGHVRIITKRSELKTHHDQWIKSPAKAPLGFIIAFEAADPILEPDQLEYWWNKGVRVISLTHYDQNDYGCGTGVVGHLSKKGFELLENMEKQKVILDVTHLSEDSFWDAMKAFNGEILASHNNCRSIIPGVRQFSDEQVKSIVDRNGVIGVAMDDWMLYKNWNYGVTPNSVVSLENVVDHIDHICKIAGDTKHAALGTDLDGGFGTESSPSDLDTIADLQKIPTILEKRGYKHSDIENIMYKNYLNKFMTTLT